MTIQEIKLSSMFELVRMLRRDLDSGDCGRLYDTLDELHNRVLEIDNLLHKWEKAHVEDKTIDSHAEVV